MTGYVIVQAESPETIGRNFRNPRWGAGGPPFSGHVPISMWDVDVVSEKLRNDFNVFRKIRRKHPTLILAALFLRGGPRPGRALPAPSQLAARGLRCTGRCGKVSRELVNAIVA